MDYLKKNHPWIYQNVFGGDKAVAYTEKNVEAKNKVTTAAESGFDIIAWVRENWQLAIVGIVALLVLLRD